MKIENLAVIFDMDGVICHTNPYHSIAFQTFFAKRGLFPTAEDFALHMFGKSNGYILSHFLEKEIQGEELMILENEKESLFREIYEPHVEAIKGYLDFVGDLNRNQVKLGIGTSAPQANMDLILSKVNVRPLMGSLLASENVTKHKPDPQVYLKSAENLGVKPSHCVVFEDSFSGVSAAINANMKVVGVLTSHTAQELPPCDWYVKDYSEMTYQKVANLFS